MTRRIGIYGGTFDPVHYGHLALAEHCREQATLDQVWFLPAGHPPHKRDHDITPGKQRAEMLEFAVAGMKEFVVDRREIRRPGPSYTVETLRELHTEHPDDEFFFLLGGDSLFDFPTWREPKEIATLAPLLVVNRGQNTLPPLDTLIPTLGPEAVSKIQIIQMPALEISSSNLRQRVQAHHSIRFLTPRPVENYITHNHLYQIPKT